MKLKLEYYLVMTLLSTEAFARQSLKSNVNQIKSFLMSSFVPIGICGVIVAVFAVWAGVRGADQRVENLKVGIYITVIAVPVLSLVYRMLK